ncbi:MAG: endonuclease III [Candidatus Dojkabacteria bacterium]|nr:endonuclease III [Candidatus Dojkabacteria bacterium]
MLKPKIQKRRPEKLARKAKIVYRKLREVYPDARCTVENHAPEQFLLASIMSPQSPDAVVNVVSRMLWEKFPTLAEIGAASRLELEQVLRPVGMFRVKSKYVQETARILLADLNGSVPNSEPELRKLPGVGRKVALIVLQEVHGIVDGIVIDTHNIRVAGRIGIVKSKDPVTIERTLMEILPKSYWKQWSHLMVSHGRAICTARAPDCAHCPICTVCDFGVKRQERTC